MKGFNRRGLFRMKQFYETYSAPELVSTLLTQSESKKAVSTLVTLLQNEEQLFELKIQEFEPEFLGKLNFYLEALDRDVKRPHENASIGILLCKGKDNEVVEYSIARNTSPAMIADYETKLIPRNVLANKLHQLV